MKVRGNVCLNMFFTGEVKITKNQIIHSASRTHRLEEMLLFVIGESRKILRKTGFGKQFAKEIYNGPLRKRNIPVMFGGSLMVSFIWPG